MVAYNAVDVFTPATTIHKSVGCCTLHGCRQSSGATRANSRGFPSLPASASFNSLHTQYGTSHRQSTSWPKGGDFSASFTEIPNQHVASGCVRYKYNVGIVRRADD